MQKPWLESYPSGVPHEISTDGYESLVDLYKEAIGEFSDRPAYTNMGKTISYGELDRLTLSFAAWIRNETKLAKGDRIAVMMPNLLQYPVVVFGALRAGLVVVNTNPLYTDRELEHQLKDSGAKAIVVVEAFAHTVADVLDHTEVETVITTKFGDMLGFPKAMLVNFVIRKIKKMVPPFSLPQAHDFKDVIATTPGTAADDAKLTLDDIAFLQYTGGTTGVAKGAMLTHKNMVSNANQALAWINSVDIKKGQEFIVTALPLYHIFALTANCMVFMKLGAQNLLITNPRDIPGFVKELGKYPFTALTGVNTLFNALLANEDFRKLDFSKMKVVLGGGMAVQEAVASDWKKVTGVTLVEAYGLTETSPAACINPMDLKEYNGAIGLPICSTDACVMDPEGNMLGTSGEGELCIRGPQVMKGYWQREDATAETIDKDGWLHTGDVAVMDEKGFFKIVDRLKDMILVSGFNVYPNEIESVIAMMPEVLEVGAIGIPDDHSGEVVKVVITKKDQSLTKEQVLAHCKENLTGYKRPKVISFVDELPKSNVGKILRRELREMG